MRIVNNFCLGDTCRKQIRTSVLSRDYCINISYLNLLLGFSRLKNYIVSAIYAEIDGKIIVIIYFVS